MDICHSGFLSLMKDIETEGIQPHTWTFLSVLFGDDLTNNAKSILSEKQITLYVARESKRSIWCISSSEGKHYAWIQENRFMCTCLSFIFGSMNKGTSPFCKHILAIFICESLMKGKNENQPFKIMEIDDQVFAQLLEKSMYEENKTK